MNFTRKPRGLRFAEISDVPFIPMESIPADGTLGSEYVMKPGKSISSGTYCEAGDVLLAKITPSLENGKQGMVPENVLDGLAVATTEVYPLKPIPSVLDRRFLFSYLMYQPVRQGLASKMEGSTGRQRLPKHVLSNLLLPLPSLPEQRAIAHVLRTVQEAKEATEKVIEATRELKRSLMNPLFTFGPVSVDEAERVPLKETEIGSVPDHWRLVRLETLLRERLRNGHSARATHTAEGVRTLTLSAVTQNDFSIKNTKLTSADSDKVRDLWLEPGDILVERANTLELVGLTALYSGSPSYAIYPDLMVRVRVRGDQVVPSFLAEFLLTASARNYFQLNARGTAGNMPKIDHGTIANTLVPLPPLDEQHEIARILKVVDEKVTAEENRKQTLDILFKTLLHNLMTGKVRVNDLNAPQVEGVV